MRPRPAALLAFLASLAAPRPGGAQGAAQGAEAITIDTVIVTGAARLPLSTVVTLVGIPTGRPISYRDVQRAIHTLYGTGQYSEVRVSQGTAEGRQALRFDLVERPLLTRWTLRGASEISEGTVRGRSRLYEGQPYDPAAAARTRATIDSIYRQKGFYLASVNLRELPQDDGSLRLVFDIDEGRRVAVARIEVDGNEHYSDKQVVDRLRTGTEGFFWFQSGEYTEDKLDADLRERLPQFYGNRGFVDFQVVQDTLLVHEESGKATLVLDLDEGLQYHVGTFEIVGNRQFPTQLLEQYYPFADTSGGGFLGLGGGRGRPIFDQARWEEASQNVRTWYYNNGYIYADLRPILTRRTGPDGSNLVDLRWQIAEGTPAIVNKVLIRGNTITHEDVIRRATSVVPGDVFRQEALLRSYQNISNLGFFEQPLPPPTYEPANDQGDVDVVFEVKERRTGNVNFGASLGQGTGVGGFIGLEEQNLFGRAKRLQLQWQFGANVNDFNVTYTDPALRGSLMSGTLSLHNSRLRYTIADLGRITTRGGTAQLGLPLFGSRYTRLYTSYTLEHSQFESETLSPTYICANCLLSSLGASVVRDTRIDMPFATSGVMHQFQLSQSGGPLGGRGNFQRATFEGRWYVPLAQLGGGGIGAGGPKVVLALTAKTGAVWGDVGPHFRQLFSMGGTQFGLPLRGYDEFSITPAGFDPNARSFQANTVGAFGRAYFAGTAEVGLRVSQALYANIFTDGGNLWSRPSQINPTRLFRGAGVGASILSPLGPIGIDYAYGFDRVDVSGNPDPAWKFHFKLGTIF
ncbi:MAG TPA: outer membrane protein assembly factor BamA [Gemmatimonadales bacterium]